MKETEKTTKIDFLWVKGVYVFSAPHAIQENPRTTLFNSFVRRSLPFYLRKNDTYPNHSDSTTKEVPPSRPTTEARGPL